jgi:hypothetical protein
MIVNGNAVFTIYYARSTINYYHFSGFEREIFLSYSPHGQPLERSIGDLLLPIVKIDEVGVPIY